MEWKDHDGRGCPVDFEKMVRVRLRNGNESGTAKPARIYTDQWTWTNGLGGMADIVAYQVIEVVPACYKEDPPLLAPTPPELALAELHREITALIVRANAEGVRITEVSTQWMELKIIGSPTTYILQQVEVRTATPA